jgi:predicted nucleic acid-binding protein
MTVYRHCAFQEKYQDEQLDIIAPYLLVSEVGSVLWKRQRRGDLSVAAAHRAFLQFLHDSPTLLESDAVSNAALGLALAHRRPFYDCLYLAWALDQRCDLVTADEKFFIALRHIFPQIRLLRTL